MNKKMVVFAALVGLVGCNSNPYSDVKGKLLPTPIQTTALQPTVNAPDVIDVTETKTVTANISGQVASGTAELSIANLPSWATFSNGTLTLSPPAGTAVDPVNPASRFSEVTLQLIIASSATPVAKTSRPILVIVHHMAGAMAIDYPQTPDLYEGTSSSQAVTIVSTDYPNGPFQIAPGGLPPGMTVASTFDAKVFNVSYKPDFGTVMVTDAVRVRNNCTDSKGVKQLCRPVTWTLTVIDPEGNSQTATITWAVFDVRQAASVVANTSFDASTGAAVALDIYASDPNMERIPTVSAGPTPAIGGTITAMEVSNSNMGGGSLPYTLTHVTWTGFDATKAVKGSTQTFTVNTCVYDQTLAPNNCIPTSINVQF